MDKSCELFTDEEWQAAEEYYVYRIMQGWGLFRIMEEHDIPAWMGIEGATTERHVIQHLALEYRQMRKGLDSK